MKITKLILLLGIAITLASHTNAQTKTVGYIVQGDFSASGKQEVAFIVRTVAGQGNPIEDGTADEYEIQFSDISLKPIEAGCCEMQLVNEGDLNEDGGDELSVFQEPMNGNTFSMTTYTFTNGIWKELIKTFLVPTGGDYLDQEQIQNMIFKENGVLYYYVVDANDENFKLIKKKAILE